MMKLVNLDRPYILPKEQILKKLKRKYANDRRIEVQLPSIESIRKALRVLFFERLFKKIELHLESCPGGRAFGF